MREIGLRDTNGILNQPWVRPRRSSAGLGWDQIFVSTQQERAYRASFDAAPTSLVILHLDGPVKVCRGSDRPHTVPVGGLFVHPAGRALTVELGGSLNTVHAYLADSAFGEEGVRLAEEVGAVDPLVEQLMLALDGAVREWEPSARTYVDHLTALLASHLARRRQPPSAAGLTSRQLAAVRDLIENRLSEPLPLTDLAGAAALSVSQFVRQFKASTGETPHRYLVGLRLRHAQRLLRTSTVPIADIAVRCGFSHQEHLTRVMRSRLGTTPGAVRLNASNVQRRAHSVQEKAL
ncbi:helix-turn-helix domain-containing protein [Kutzneria buriramensis]|uniref:AraC family transcriptional regulator n=1 Tax=Kutzneria buriramensis TaxID=1045776 RepID=A0A3E0I5L0_9PSEU|nr:AraC family transcriptional regulator [Kutzneria buriramensis]REH53880.1 AraC family transcriptional regulator [Kutzneria buriramensis]